MRTARITYDLLKFSAHCSIRSEGRATSWGNQLSVKPLGTDRTGRCVCRQLNRIREAIARDTPKVDSASKLTRKSSKVCASVLGSEGTGHQKLLCWRSNDPFEFSVPNEQGLCERP
eukprot:81907-Prorocentrum_minimum.AAC.3